MKYFLVKMNKITIHVLEKKSRVESSHSEIIIYEKIFYKGNFNYSTNTKLIIKIQNLVFFFFFNFLSSYYYIYLLQLIISSHCKI